MKTKVQDLKPSPRYVKAGQNDRLFLSIRIGNQQIGGSSILKDDTVLLKGDLSDKTFLGNAGELYNENLIFATAVLDMNPMTNMCVISTAITNQDNQLLFSYNDNAEAPENGIVTFKGIYRIIPVLLLFICLFIFSDTYAQKSVVEFKKLETPTSPGFALLDETPESIAKPTTPQGLTVNFITLLQGSGGAVEFAPFWLWLHPNRTIQKMYDTKAPIFSTLSVSAATIKKDQTTYLTGGIRTRVFQSFGTTRRADMNAAVGQIIAELATYAGAVATGNTAQEVNSATKITDLRKNFVEYYEDPQFTIDLAAAVGGTSETSSYKEIKYDRWATWASFNLKFSEKFSSTLLTRYITNEEIENIVEKTDVADLGVRCNYEINDHFSVSAEYLQRFVFDTTISPNRLAAIGSWKIMDNVFATATFGKNFDSVSNIIAVGGVKFGFAEKEQNF